jgi:predicted MPP superfamily phosphohydrolase
MTRRPQLYLAIFVGVAFIALSVYSTWIEPYRIDVTRHDLRSAGKSERFKLVQVSDLHLHAFGKHERELAKQIAALNADVIVLSGDAIDRVEAVPWLRAFVDELGSVPVLLVLGNWEHWSAVSVESLKSTGAKLLLNERWNLRKGKRSLTVLGLDDYTAGQPDLGLLSINSSDDGSQTTVLVQHSPGFFDQASVKQKMKTNHFDLCLSGHTHGGQVALLGWAPMRPVGSGRYTSGFYEIVGCPLYVSRGIGTSVLPIRFGSHPELAVFEL